MKPFSTSFVVFLLSLLVAGPLFAQRPAIKPALTPTAIDSTRQVRSATDTIPNTIRRNGVPVQVGKSVLTPDDSTSLDDSDTLRVTAKQEAQIHKIIPKKATLRSVMLPGLGQAYNRQYYKIPFIYAGFGVMGYLFIRYRALALEAETGYRQLLYKDLLEPAYPVTLDPALFPSGITQALTVDATYQPLPDKVLIGQQYFYTSAGAKNAYDTYRRYRDLNILLSVVLYAVNIVEANVAAHLKTFDLTDDISMRVDPNVLPMPGSGFVPGVRVAFTFK